MIYLDTSAFVKLRSITREFLAADRKLVNVANKKGLEAINVEEDA